MKDFVVAICIVEGLNTILRLIALGRGHQVTLTSEGIALNIALSIAILIWGSALLSKK